MPLPLSSRAMPGAGTTLAATRFGQTVGTAVSRKWRHPWFTQAAWNPQAKRWCATVLPGFVNGNAPIWRATVAEQQAVGNPWENNPLTGKPFFSDPIFGRELQTVALKMVDLPLYLSPAIPLDFRNLGWDGDSGAGSDIPAFFLNMGVAKAPQQPSAEAQLLGDAQPVDATPPAGLRLLRACDIWITQPRAALTSSFAVGSLGVAPYIQTLTVDTSNAHNPVRILEGTMPPPPPPPDPTQNDYTEATFDQLLISTVYLVSAPNTPLGSEPDASWTPFVRHNVSWNLSWAQPYFSQPASDLAHVSLLPLAAGAATLLIGINQSLLADAQQTAVNILAGASLAGTFWTATGGGHDATYAALATEQAAPQGPDRNKNAAAKLAFTQQQRRAVTLDPDFPFNALPFPVSFLTP